MIRSLALRSHRIAAWALVAGVAAQLAMTTFGVFVIAGSRGYLLHVTFGRLLAVLPVLVLLTALAAGVDRRGLAAAAGLIGLVIVQVGLVMLAREGVAVAMALHPVNGGLLFVAAGYLAGRADGYVVEPAGGTRGVPVALERASAPGA
jgi:hypothetical protein